MNWRPCEELIREIEGGDLPLDRKIVSPRGPHRVAGTHEGVLINAAGPASLLPCPAVACSMLPVPPKKVRRRPLREELRSVNPTPPLHLESSDDNHSFVRSAVEQYQGALLRYATRLMGDADRARDVVQDTFLRLLSQPMAAVDGHLAEWLFTVCRNRAFDLHRKEGRMKHFEEGEVERVTAHEPRPGTGLEAAETHAAVLRLIDRLPRNQQEVIRLKFQNGFSYKEISRITKLSIGNVGFLIHTAIKALRREWTASAADQPRNVSAHS